jgi:hypothetical protein
MTITRAFIALIIALGLWGSALAQDMDALDTVYRQGFEQNRNQRETIQRQLDDLRGIKSQVDSIMAQIEGRSSPTYTEQAEKYRQIEVIVPVAIRFSQELDRKQKQLDQLDQERETIRAKVLERQNYLPLWWRE